MNLTSAFKYWNMTRNWMSIWRRKLLSLSWRSSSCIQQRRTKIWTSCASLKQTVCVRTNLFACEIFGKVEIHVVEFVAACRHAFVVVVVDVVGSVGSVGAGVRFFHAAAFDVFEAIRLERFEHFVSILCLTKTNTHAILDDEISREENPVVVELRLWIASTRLCRSSCSACWRTPAATRTSSRGCSRLASGYFCLD